MSARGGLPCAQISQAAGRADPYNGLVILGDGFPSAAQGRVPVADSGAFNRLFHNLPKQYSDIHPIQGLQPRLGIAYGFSNKTVVRGSVGRYLTRLGVSDSVFLGGNPPFQPSASVSVGSVDNPGSGASNSFPLPVTTQDRVFKNPEAWAWNGAIQHEVGFQTTVEVAYAGRRGLHAQQEIDLNGSRRRGDRQPGRQRQRFEALRGLRHDPLDQ